MAHRGYVENAPLNLENKLKKGFVRALTGAKVSGEAQILSYFYHSPFVKLYTM